MRCGGTGCAQPFVAFTGYAFTRQWFFRVGLGSSTSAGAPTTALLLELRQRQLIMVPSEGALFDTPLDVPAGSGSSRYAKVDFDAVDSLYEAGMAGPACGPLLRLFLAQYMRVYCHNRHLELSQLRVLQHVSCPFDVAFFVHQRLREVKLEEKAGSAKGNVSIEAHVKFDALKARADRQVPSSAADVLPPLPPCPHQSLACVTLCPNSRKGAACVGLALLLLLLLLLLLVRTGACRAGAPVGVLGGAVHSVPLTGPPGRHRAVHRTRHVRRRGVVQAPAASEPQLRARHAAVRAVPGGGEWPAGVGWGGGAVELGQPTSVGAARLVHGKDGVGPNARGVACAGDKQCQSRRAAEHASGRPGGNDCKGVPGQVVPGGHVSSGGNAGPVSGGHGCHHR